MLLMLSLLGALGACAAPEPAPTEVEDLSRFFLNNFESQDAELLAQGAANLESWYAEQVGEGDLGGELEDLQGPDLLALGMPEDIDPSALVGVFHLTPQDCTMSDISGIFLYPEQQELFPGNYLEYSREYQGDTSCFAPGECDSASWRIDIKTALALGTEMTYSLDSGMRRVRPEADALYTTPFMMSRTVLPQAATVDGAGYFDQSYQIEAFLPTDDGVLHLYALWNAGGVDGLDPEADFWKRQYLDSIVEWDERIDELCAEPALWGG